MTRGLFAKRTPAYAATAHDDFLPPMPRADARQSGLLHGMWAFVCGSSGECSAYELQRIADGHGRAVADGHTGTVADGHTGTPLLASLGLPKRIAQ